MTKTSETARCGSLPGPVRGVALRSLYQAMAVARLTMQNLVISNRTALVVLLACVPVGIAFLLRHVLSREGNPPPGHEIFTGLFVTLYVYFVTLLTSILYGTSLFSDERSDRTITFLLTRPVPRGVIVLGKFLPYALSAAAMLLISLAATHSILSGMDWDAESFRESVPFWAHARVVVLALIAYGAVFTFLGATFRRPVIAAFVYCFAWESILPYLPVFLKKLTLMHYVHSLIPNWTSEGGVLAFIAEPTPPEQAVRVLLGICVAFLVLTVISLYMKEHTFEKEKEL